MPYYVISEDKKGNPTQFGPYTYREANDVRDRCEREGKPGEIIHLRTRNPDTATRLIKEGRVEKLGIDEGTRRMSHPTMVEDR